MQNKPNFPDTQMNLSSFPQKAYEIFTPMAGYKNKPNSNPIKACPERFEFTLSVIEGNGPISEKPK
jgi:hypothetical protein